MLLNDMHTDWNSLDDDTRPAIVTLSTDGKGYWSNAVKSVGVTALSLGYICDPEEEGEEPDFGELRVHFNTTTWRPDKDGLIYTDKLFMHGLQNYLTSIGLCGDDVGYSEQGMQGDNYVSCDVGGEFLASYKAKFPAEYKTALQE